MRRVAAWGIKGRYDYIRPISAIRWMEDRGQSTDPNLPGCSPAGIPLIPSFVEVVQEGDSLARENGENVGKIKLYAWRGHDYINDPKTEVQGTLKQSHITPSTSAMASGICLLRITANTWKLTQRALIIK